jgi:hypothetical protein
MMSKGLFTEPLTNSKLVLAYTGMITNELINSLLNILEKNLEKSGVPTKTRKRVFLVVIEALQNILRHADIDSHKEEDRLASIELVENEDFYRVFTRNLMLSDKVDGLGEKLSYLNSLDSLGIKELYRSVLTNNEISEKGGAGLGFIEIVRKTERKLEFVFLPEEGKYSCFTLMVDIPKENNL